MNSVCRACLSKDQNAMLPLVEDDIEKYNILTSLNVTTEDEMPQTICQNCWNSVQQFILFRTNCLASDLVLRENKIVGLNPKIEDEIDFKKNITCELDIKHYSSGPCSPKDEFKSELSDDWPNEEERICQQQHFEFKDVIIKLNKITDQHKNDSSNCDSIQLIRKQLRTRPSKAKLKKVTTKKGKNKSNKYQEESDSRIPCGLCPLKFFDNNNFIIHIESHKTNPTCSICDEHCTDWQQLFGHRFKHIQSKYKICHKCGKRSQCDINMEYHLRIHHSSEEFQGMKCSICLHTFKSARRLKIHIQNQHSEKQFICDICSKTSKNKPNLVNHIRNHSTAKHHVCLKCDYSCKSKSNLKVHILRHHTESKFYCKYCTRVFEHEEGLDKHPCTRLWMCSACGKQFTVKKQLQRHQQSHSDEKPFKCILCPASYKRKPGLRDHLLRHEGRRTKRCEYCPATFYSASVLQKHRRIHTGEKPYVCKICNKGFTANHNLKVHMKVHGIMLIVKKETKKEIDPNAKK